MTEMLYDENEKKDDEKKKLVTFISVDRIGPASRMNFVMRSRPRQEG